METPKLPAKPQRASRDAKAGAGQRVACTASAGDGEGHQRRGNGQPAASAAVRGELMRDEYCTRQSSSPGCNIWTSARRRHQEQRLCHRLRVEEYGDVNASAVKDKDLIRIQEALLYPSVIYLRN